MAHCRSPSKCLKNGHFPSNQIQIVPDSNCCKLFMDNRLPARTNFSPDTSEAKKRPEVLLLMSHPGVGPITGLVYVLVIGTPDRFPCGKQLGSYTGLIPCEDSSAGRQRLGHISKQGNKLLRYLLGEAAQAAARCNPDWRLSVCAPDDAPAKKNCQSGHGQKTRCSVVLDVA